MKTTIEKLKESYGKSYIWVLLFTAITFVKAFIGEGLMEATNISLWFICINLLIIFAIYTTSLVLPDKWRVPGLFLSYGILSTLIFMDLVHFRYFRTPISIYSIYSAGQLSAVGDSVKSLIKPMDILLFVDIAVLGIIFWVKKIVINNSLRDERIIAFVTSILILFSASYLNGLKVDKTMYTINQLGLVNYHLHDIVQFFNENKAETASMQEYLNRRNGNKKRVEDLKAYGIAKGRNVFVIQVEALQNFVINREIEGKPITPVLNSLISNDSFYFDKYFQQLGRGNTSDAEFVSHNSLYASMRSFSYKEYEGVDLYNLPNALKAKGYSTIAFHGNDPDFWNRKNAYPAQGLDTFISVNEMENDEIIGMGISDGSVFRQSMDYYKQLKQPFYSFFVTLTSHHPFIVPENLKGLSVEGEYKGTMLGNYIESISYFDKVLGEFIEDLKEAGLYENSVIAIYGDHFGIEINDTEIKEQASNFLNREYNYDDLLNIPLIIHVPGAGTAETISTAGGQLDFFPTILNILGITPSSDYLMGQDLINAEEGFVAQQNIMNKGSFIDDEKIFEMSSDGRFENSKAWKLYTGEPVDLDLCREGYERAIEEINLSTYLADNYAKGNNQIEIDKDKKIIFSDIVDHRSEEAIKYMVEKEIVSGKTDSRFYPDEPITKAEFLKVLLSSFNIEVDTSIGGQWWAPYANVAIDKKIIKDDDFNGIDAADQFISIEDGLIWLENAIDRSNSNNLDKDNFINNISKDLNLNSTDKLTRGLATEILYNAIK